MVNYIKEQALKQLLQVDDALAQATSVDETVTTFDIRNKQIQVKKTKRETYE